MCDNDKFFSYSRLPTYPKRSVLDEMNNLYQFLTKGIDAEDIYYLKRSYEALLGDDIQGYWLNDTHWVDHPDILFSTTVQYNLHFLFTFSKMKYLLSVTEPAVIEYDEYLLV